MNFESVALREVFQILAAQLAWFEAALLAAAAVHKVLSWPRTKSVARRFAGVPHGLTKWVSSAAVGIELTAAALLVFPMTRAAGASVAALLWVVYLASLLRSIRANQRDVDCGCSFGSTHRPLGAFQVARNAVLVMMALAVAGVSLLGGVSSPWSQALAACALLALYAALDQVMVLQPLRNGEVL